MCTILQSRGCRCSPQQGVCCCGVCLFISISMRCCPCLSQKRLSDAVQLSLLPAAEHSIMSDGILQIEQPSSSRAEEPDMPCRMLWLIPNAVSPPRDGTDRKGQACTVFDFVVHPVAVQFALETKTFRVRLLCHADVVDEQGDSTFHICAGRLGCRGGHEFE